MDDHLLSMGALPEMLHTLDVMTDRLLLDGLQDDLICFFKHTLNSKSIQEHVISTRNAQTRSSLVKILLAAVPHDDASAHKECFKFVLRYFVVHGGEPLLSLEHLPLSLNDQTACFIETVAPYRDTVGEFTIRDLPRLSTFWKTMYPIAREGGFSNYFTTHAGILPDVTPLWCRWFTALASSSPEICELAKQVLLYYRPKTPEHWVPHVWNGERAKALQRAVPDLFEPASAFLSALLSTCCERYLAGSHIPLHARIRLCLGFQGDADDAATVLNNLPWCTGRPDVLLLEARDSRIRTFFSCRERFFFVTAVVAAGKARQCTVAKKSRTSEDAGSNDAAQVTAILMDPRICSREGGTRMTSPYAAAIASFL